MLFYVFRSLSDDSFRNTDTEGFFHRNLDFISLLVKNSRLSRSRYRNKRRLLIRKDRRGAWMMRRVFSRRASLLVPFWCAFLSIIALQTDGSWVDPDTEKEYYSSAALSVNDDRKFELVSVAL